MLCLVLFPINRDETSLTPGQQIPCCVSNLPFMIQLPALVARDKSLHDNFRVHRNRPLVLNAQIRRHRMFPAEPGGLAHDLVQQHGNDSAVQEARTALIFLAEGKMADNSLALVVLFERELHPMGVPAATAKTHIIGFRIESHEFPLVSPAGQAPTYQDT